MVAGQSATLENFGVDGGETKLELSELAGDDRYPEHSMSGRTGVLRPVFINKLRFVCAEKTKMKTKLVKFLYLRLNNVYCEP